MRPKFSSTTIDSTPPAMVTYPIRIQRKTYRGSDLTMQFKASEYNRVAGMLEEYVNEQIEKRNNEYQRYIYYELAADLGLEGELVRRILLLFSVNGDDNSSRW